MYIPLRYPNFAKFGVLTIGILLLSWFNIYAQEDQSPSGASGACETSLERKASISYDYAVSFYHQNKNEAALEQLDNATKICASFAKGYMLKGVIYEDLHKIDSAIMAYTTAITYNPEIFPNVYLTLGKLEYSLGMYEEAEKHLTRFLRYENSSAKLLSQAHDYKKRNLEALLLSKNRVPFSPVNMGDSINTTFDEYLPLESLDGESIILTRRYERSEPEPHLEEDFFISYKDSIGIWSLAERMPEPVNSDGNEGAQSISADGRFLYFAGCGRENGRGSCDIYVCVKTDGKWGKPINLGYPVNTIDWESQPSISSDGRTLYFCSNKPGGYGGSDIWKTFRSKDGIWSNPINLGPNINTTSNENSPFIHPDQKTLYFSSNGHPGLGGLDLFYSRLNESGEWDTAINLGYPINTWADEATLSVNREGNTAYFSSSQYGGKGGLDIYKFELYKDARPELVSFMKGIIKDKNTLKTLEASLELIELNSGKTVVETYSDASSGEFLVCLPSGSYALNISKDNYLFYSEHFDLVDSNAFTPLYAQILLSPIASGEKMILRNIFYAVDSYLLDSSSYVELSKLSDFLQKHNNVKIEVSGHTDASGREEYNLSLSEKRATQVANYLFEQGIPKERINIKGYGSSMPVAGNSTEEERQLNRRTEIKIL